eukprot:TRINITY_DN27708_c0_g1_i1.p1 TRINITY_DN27708_c0_g1~~TRINITY_DN27708_c0_g1_i1.p1  ORF type:complete len:208 (-),score=36.17 TRINITY_DN27708_c0_g1_i1:32-655(-)
MFRMLKHNPDAVTQFPYLRKQDLKNRGLTMMNVEMEEGEFEKLWAAADLNGNGTLDYYEFLAAFDPTELMAGSLLYDPKACDARASIKKDQPRHTGHTAPSTPTGVDWKNACRSLPARMGWSRKLGQCATEFSDEWPQGGGVEPAPPFGAPSTGGRHGRTPYFHNSFSWIRPSPLTSPHMTGEREEQLRTVSPVSYTHLTLPTKRIV